MNREETDAAEMWFVRRMLTISRTEKEIDAVLRAGRTVRSIITERLAELITNNR